MWMSVCDFCAKRVDGVRGLEGGDDVDEDGIHVNWVPFEEVTYTPFS